MSIAGARRPAFSPDAVAPYPQTASRSAFRAASGANPQNSRCETIRTAPPCPPAPPESSAHHPPPNSPPARSLPPAPARRPQQSTAPPKPSPICSSLFLPIHSLQPKTQPPVCLSLCPQCLCGQSALVLWTAHTKPPHLTPQTIRHATRGHTRPRRPRVLEFRCIAEVTVGARFSASHAA